MGFWELKELFNVRRSPRASSSRAPRGDSSRRPAPRPGWTLLAAITLTTLAAFAPWAGAQLQPSQVLVVYDSRIPDSLAVAEYYAGSAKVPGGAGGRAGTRPGVRVFDLATSGAALEHTPDVAYADFIANIRDPLRAYLTANDNGPAGTIRCLVMTMGLPHRVMDVTGGKPGDDPITASTAMFTSGNYTNCSVDSELSLLWQNLSAGENGVSGDSFADGLIVNPFWRATQPISTWPTTNRGVAKAFTSVTLPAAYGPAKFWVAALGALTAPPGATKLGPGDMYLVCRLDGWARADVLAMIDRAAGLVINVNTGVIILDESNSDGVADTSPNSEFDNQGVSPINGGDDYEQTRDALTTDARYLAANIRYDALTNTASPRDVSHFFVGPLTNYDGEGTVISGPVLLLATEGANHGATNGGPFPGDLTGHSAASTYPGSFNYAPGAIFNSIESYNGRSLGGLPPILGQASTSHFIESGGTFAIGNVFEPFTFTIADNFQLAKNFLMGNMSWAEAAYTALPALSFQQIVLGDPLARPTRTSEDVDSDGQITIDDLYSWTAAPTDINRNGSPGETDRKFVEDAVRAGRGTDMPGMQR